MTRSVSIAAASGSAATKRSGMTIVAPAMAHAYGKPHAFAWNIGTTGSTRSLCLIATLSARHLPSACRMFERCEYRTPFGLPVVPLV